jgi:hypothetical protein
VDVNIWLGGTFRGYNIVVAAARKRSSYQQAAALAAWRYQRACAWRVSAARALPPLRAHRHRGRQNKKPLQMVGKHVACSVRLYRALARCARALSHHSACEPDMGGATAWMINCTAAVVGFVDRVSAWLAHASLSRLPLRFRQRENGESAPAAQFGASAASSHPAPRCAFTYLMGAKISARIMAPSQTRAIIAQQQA